MAVRVPGLVVEVGRRVYPWDEWMDGSAWTAHPGNDFDVESHVFQSYLYEVARKSGKTVVTRMNGDGSVTFKFNTNTKKEAG